MDSGVVHLSREAVRLTRCHTGVVIPVFLPADPGRRRTGESLLEDTTVSFLDGMADPGQVCLAVDGGEFGGEVAASLGERHGVSVVTAEVNRGKLQPVLLGARRLLGREGLKYLAVVDQDGDHFANELPNLVRAAEHAARSGESGKVIVVGRRISRHRPMGFLRGELEELANRVLLDALQYRAARRNLPLDLRFSSLLDDHPDFQSGFKLYSRETADGALGQDPPLLGLPDDAAFRHACEVVPMVEGLERGATLVSVNRSTFNEQPVSTFGQLDRCRLIADKILWPCKRLEVPPAFVRQWMLNHGPRLLLSALVPQGKEELENIFRLVLEGYGEKPGGDGGRPLFL